MCNVSERRYAFLIVLWTHPFQRIHIIIQLLFFCRLAFMQEIFSLDISKYSHKLFVLRIALPMFTPDFPNLEIVPISPLTMPSA